MPKITKILAREILDSRGNPTVEATVFTKDNKASASAPSGESKGKHEALELRDGGTRYLGMGVLKAVRNVKGPIAKRLIGRDVCQQEFIDEALIHLDGTPNKSRLGANSIVAVSMACARLGAKEENKPLFKHIMKNFNLRNARMPRPFFNIINGGKHAGSELAVQEYMITPKARKFSEALRKGSEVYHALKKRLARKYGSSAVNVGDEGGFAPPLKCIDAPMDEIMNAALEFTYANDIKLAIDSAATSFYNKSRYLIEGGFKTRAWLTEWYVNAAKAYPIISIEDPFYEEDFEGFAELNKKIGKNFQIVGDDLLCTNIKLIEKAIEMKSCNALLLKVNQIGTVTEAIRAAQLAIKHKWNVMVSHRSGETNDNFIAHLAVALGCGQIKSGAPCRGERLAKYNELLRIEEECKIKT